MTAQATDRLDERATPAHGGPDEPEVAPTAPTTDRPARDDVIRVADTLIDLLRSFNRTRARMLAAAAHDVEWSAHILLKCASLEGPIRASALAEAVQSDPSTVSRQVAALVKDGLLERRADPEDGRASLLVTTPKAQAVLAEHDDIRIEHFTRMLMGWTHAELREFAAMLERFTGDYDKANVEWLRQKIAAHAASPEGKS